MNDIAQIKEILKNRREYIEKFLKIRTKNAKLIKFKLNPVQLIVLDKIEELERQNKPIRLIILKARQQGISTLVQGILFHKTVTKKYQSNLVMTHEPDSTKSLFGMQKLFFEKLPDLLKPMKRYDNSTQLTFDNPKEKDRESQPGLKSYVSIATASKDAVGRGVTINCFHGSEVAFWRNAQDIMLGVAQAVPSTSDSMIILESTANGVGGFLHDNYWKAKKGENDYTAIFIPWFAFPDYSMPCPDGFTLTEEEILIKNKFGLSNEQMQWRRWCIANNCDGDVMRFQQEYPATDHEAFIASGRPKFDMVNLKIYLENAKPPLFVGDLISENTKLGVQTPILSQNSRGNLRIYELPNKRCSYVIGGDTAKGTVTSDNSCLQVINRHTGDLVATLYGKVRPEDLAYEAARLGYYYNQALVGVEVNRDGITTNEILYRELRYPRLFKRRVIDSTNKKQIEKLGFYTSEKSRSLIINELARWIKDGEFAIHDQTTLRECMTFVIMDNGKAEAQEGCHDDSVMALAIAIYLYDFAQILPPPKTEIERNIAKTYEQMLTPNW
jgi:hypothetical protein